MNFNFHVHHLSMGHWALSIAKKTDGDFFYYLTWNLGCPKDDLGEWGLLRGCRQNKQKICAEFPRRLTPSADLSRWCSQHHCSMMNSSFLQWEFQDPKMEVLYHIRPHFVGIFPYCTWALYIYIYMVGTSNLGSWNSHWFLYIFVA